MTNTSAGWPSSSADKDPKHIPAVAIRTAKFISLPPQPDICIWLLLASKQLRRIRRVVSGAARVVHRRLTVAVRTHFMGIRLCVFKQANIRWQLLIELPRSQISEIRCGIKRSGHLSVRIPNQVDCRLQLRTGKKTFHQIRGTNANPSLDVQGHWATAVPSTGPDQSEAVKFRPADVNPQSASVRSGPKRGQHVFTVRVAPSKRPL